MWTRHQQQQQRGAQMHARAKKTRPAGEAPEEATRDRAAQEHDRADLDVSGETLPPGDYPASPIEHKDQDNTPSAPAPRVAWDDVVQPERRKSGHPGERDERPLPQAR